MDKYSAHGIAHAALNGRRILIITENQRASREALNLLAASDSTHHADKVRRVNGLEGIDYQSGGSIRIRSWRSSGHCGISADTVYLDTGVDANLPTDHRIALAATLSASPTGELIAA